MGWFGNLGQLWGYVRLLEITPFDAARTICYYPSITTICPHLAPFLRYSQILVENHRF